MLRATVDHVLRKKIRVSNRSSKASLRRSNSIGLLARSETAAARLHLLRHPHRPNAFRSPRWCGFHAKHVTGRESRISNRYKIAVFSSELPVHARNRQEASPPEFPWAPWRLIANLRLKFLSSASKSIKYKFLIANRSHFLWRKRTSSGSDSASPQRTGTETRCVSLAPIPYSWLLLPDFGAAARLSWQELNCGSCHTFHRRLDHVWTLKMGHDQA